MTSRYALQDTVFPRSHEFMAYHLQPSTFNLSPKAYHLQPQTTTYNLPPAGWVQWVALFFYNSSFWSPIVRVHHLLNSLAQCSAFNSVLNGVGSKDFKVSRHQNFEVLGSGFPLSRVSPHPNFKFLGFQGLATVKLLRSWVSRVSLHIEILRSWVSRVPREKGRARSKVHQGPRPWTQRTQDLGSFWDLGTSLEDSIMGLKLSSRFFNLFVLPADTTSCGNLFHAFTTLLAKIFALACVLALLILSFRWWPLVLQSWLLIKELILIYVCMPQNFLESFI